MHSVSNPSRVRMVGPVAPYLPGLVEEFASLGYATTSAAEQLRLAASLSRWLVDGGLDLGDVTESVLRQYVAERRARGVKRYSSLALGPMVGYLRRVGAIPGPAAPAPAARESDVLLVKFGAYLSGQRGLTPPVVTAYTHWVRPFVDDVVASPGLARIDQLNAGMVAGFLTARLPLMSRKSAQMTASAMRSFLRFLHAEAMTDTALAEAVPRVASWRLSGLPQPLAKSQVRMLLAACDDSTPVGRRDRAVITLMSRMGLRCAEVATLRLEDIDWAAGTIIVHGKGGRVDRMPLPVDAGQALVAYLRDGRPDTPTRTVFVRAVAPVTELHRSSVSCIVARAAKRAGLGTIHGHRLRHTAASETLNAGASLEEVAQLLRHDGVATTVVYAKVDQNRLARLARPWPVGSAVPR